MITEPIEFVRGNLTLVFGIAAIIFIIINVIQYKTNQLVKDTFAGIIHTSSRAYRKNESAEKTSREFDNLMISIRYQAVSGLRASESDRPKVGRGQKVVGSVAGGMILLAAIADLFFEASSIKVVMGLCGGIIGGLAGYRSMTKQEQK